MRHIYIQGKYSGKKVIITFYIIGALFLTIGLWSLYGFRVALVALGLSIMVRSLTLDREKKNVQGGS